MNTLRLILLCAFLFDTQLYAVHDPSGEEESGNDEGGGYEEYIPRGYYIPRRYIDNLDLKILRLAPKSLFRTYKARFLKGNDPKLIAYEGVEEFANCVQKSSLGYYRIDKIFVLRNYGGATEKLYQQDTGHLHKRETIYKTSNQSYELNTSNGKMILKINSGETTTYCVSIATSG